MAQSSRTAERTQAGRRPRTKMQTTGGFENGERPGRARGVGVRGASVRKVDLGVRPDHDIAGKPRLAGTRWPPAHQPIIARAHTSCARQARGAMPDREQDEGRAYRPTDTLCLPPRNPIPARKKRQKTRITL